jgi:MFS family permease
VSVAPDAVTASRPVEQGRPAALLPWPQLGLISVYWFGINAVWGAYEGFGQKQIELIVGKASVGSVMGPLELLGGLIAIIVVPTVGSLSDYTTSRFGKRKGYILTGATFDLLLIGGLSLIAMAQPRDWDGQALAGSQTLVVYALLFLGLQVSSNVAQGPYQGFVPDLVAEPQVGVASGLVGVMRTVGLVAGFAIMAVGARVEAWGLAFLIVGFIEFGLAVLTFRFVDNGPPGMPRQGRSLSSIARETWDPGILHERSFVRMTLVRFFFLMGTGTFINISLLYLERVFGIQDPDERSTLWMAALGMALAGTILAAIVGARISDRTGRKPVVWAAAAIAAAGIVLLAVAPVPAVALVGALFLGAGSGAYLAVDWALMTEIIPLAASGRFMGIANIANSIAGPLGLAVAGPIMDAFFRAGDVAMGPRVAVGVGVVALALASYLLIGVHPRRDPRTSEAAAAA